MENGAPRVPLVAASRKDDRPCILVANRDQAHALALV